MRTGTHEKLSNVDAAWLRMDGPANAMVINAASLFADAVSYTEFAQLLEERLLSHERFRQQVLDAELPFKARVGAATHHSICAYTYTICAFPLLGMVTPLRHYSGCDGCIRRARRPWQDQWFARADRTRGIHAQGYARHHERAGPTRACQLWGPLLA